MEKVILKGCKKMLTCVLLVLCVNVMYVPVLRAIESDEDTEVDYGGDWKGRRGVEIYPISIYQNSQYLTIQDSNPVNTITVRITRNDSGATVFENVYPQGQTGLIVIPLQGWSAGSYTIELFGRENNGYLVGTFQILP